LEDARVDAEFKAYLEQSGGTKSYEESLQNIAEKTLQVVREIPETKEELIQRGKDNLAERREKKKIRETKAKQIHDADVNKRLGSGKKLKMKDFEMEIARRAKFDTSSDKMAIEERQEIARLSRVPKARERSRISVADKESAELREQSNLIRKMKLKAKAAKKQRKHDRREERSVPVKSDAGQAEEKFEIPSMEALKEEHRGFMAPLEELCEKHELVLANVHDLLTFVYQLRRCRNFGDAYCACYMYVTNFCDRKFSDRVKFAIIGSMAMEVVSMLKDEKPKSDGFISDKMQTLSDLVNMTVSSEFVKAVKTVVMTAAGLRFFSKETSVNIYKVVGRPESMSVGSLIQTMFEALIQVVRVAEALAAGCSWSEALFTKDPISTYIASARELLVYKDKLYSGLPTPGMMDRCFFVTRAKEIMLFFDTAMKKMSPLCKEYREMSAYNLQLLSCVCEIDAAVKSACRIQPAAIVIHGKPGVGKSYILQHIAATQSKVMNREFQQSFIYPRNCTSQYWEGYLPFSHPILWYSELGAKAVGLVKTAGDVLIDELTSVVNTLPFSCDMAFEGKGKVFVLAELVLIDTNNVSLNLPLLVNNPAAFERRFLYVEPIVKEKYRQEGSCLLDSSKCEDGSDFMDRWYFKVVSKVPVSATHSNVIEHLSGDEKCDVHAFTDFLVTYFRKHYAKGKDLLEKTQADRINTIYGSILKREAESVIDVTAEVKDSVELREAFTLANVLDAGEVIGMGVGLDEPPLFDDEKYAAGEHSMISSDSFMEDVRAKISEKCNIITRPTVMNVVNAGIDVVSTGMHLLGCHLTYAFLWGMNAAYSRSDLKHSRKSIWQIGYWQVLVAFILPFFTGWTWTFSFVRTVFLHGVWKMIEPICDKQIVDLQLDKAGNMCNYYVDYFKYQIGFCPDFPLLSDPKSYTGSKRSLLTIVAAICAALVGAKVTVDVIRRHFHKDSEGFSKFYIEDENNEKINKIEENAHCGGALKRVENRALGSWNVIQTTFASELHEGDLDSVYTRIMRNVRRVEIRGGDSRSMIAYIFGIKGSYALINTHSLMGLKEFEANVSMTGDPFAKNEVFAKSMMTPNYYQHLGNDLTLLRLSFVQFLDVTKYFAKDSIFPRVANAYIAGERVVANYKESVLRYDDPSGPIEINRYFNYKWESHKKGSCGNPLLLCKDSGYVLAGIHCAAASGVMSFATVIDGPRVLMALEDIGLRTPLMEVASEAFDMYMPTEDPLAKSPFRYENLQGANYYGKVLGIVNAHNSSKLKPTFLVEEKMLEPIFEKYFGEPENHYGKPMMNPVLRDGEWISPWNIALRKLGKQKLPLHRDTLSFCIDRLTKHILENFHDKGVKPWNPMTMDLAINGAVDDPFLRRINVATSGGFGWSGSKKKCLPIAYVDLFSVTREPTSELKDRVVSMAEHYAKGETNFVTFKANLKDEPRTLQKCKEGKTRVFCGSPVDSLILSRMFLSPFYTSMVEHSSLFGTCVGVNMHKEANIVYDDLLNFSKNIMEGDYGNFDQSMPFDISWAAGSVVMNICEAMGYCPDALTILSGIITDGLFPFLEMNGDILCSPGYQPSGKYGTAEDNSLKGVILLMYFWYSTIHTQDLDFFDYVKPKTYGDDLLAAVKDEVKEFFNNVTYAEFVERVYGMTYTTASKTSDLLPFVKSEDMTFLKRHFVFHDELKRVVAPLDTSSLFRTLQWWSPSKFVNEQEQMISMLDSVLRESIFHLDQEKFNMFRSDLVNVFSRHFEVDIEVVETLFSTYEKHIHGLSL